MYVCLCVAFLLQSDFGVSLTHTYLYFATTAIVFFVVFFHISVQRFLQNYPDCWMMRAADDEILFFSLFEKVLLKLLIDMFLGYILCSVHLFFFFFCLLD